MAQFLALNSPSQFSQMKDKGFTQCMSSVMKLMIATQAAKVVYPSTEAEILAAEADTERANLKVRVATMYGPCTPIVARSLPGSPDRMRAYFQSTDSV